MASKMIKLYDKDGNWCQPMINHIITSGHISAGQDFNDFLQQGEFGVGYKNEGAEPLNGPYSGSIYGKLIVHVNDNGVHNNLTNWVWQIFIDTSEKIYVRRKINDLPFSVWRRMYTSTILYDNPSGYVGTINLNESSAEFEYLEIFFTDQDGAQYNEICSQRVHSPNGKKVDLTLSSTDKNRKGFWTKYKTMLISGTTISNVMYGEMVHLESTFTASNFIRVLRVVGYR